eukprot:TRINITY_DN6429_c0_g1_i4.p1 TRINITY_DN6429_c0_g1~~TRINITY_DN6429_c0_g1_i4.p1  ORF type:complete len:368 (+),score=97.21 TRINITY_DN6429_c0_g1_i4:230-1333(+)
MLSSFASHGYIANPTLGATGSRYVSFERFRKKKRPLKTRSWACGTKRRQGSTSCRCVRSALSTTSSSLDRKPPHCSSWRRYNSTVAITTVTMYPTQETGTSIKVPKTKKEEEAEGIVVRGLNERSVVDCKHRIDYIVEKSRDKLPFTHFVGIPLDMGSLTPKVAHLLDDIKQNYANEKTKIHPSVVQRPEKLHLTLLVLRLYNDEDLQRAARVLREIEDDVKRIFNQDDRLKIKGISCMNDDPSIVNVAYLEVVKDIMQQKVLELVEAVSQRYILSGLCTSRDVEGNRLLHATILNSKWRATEADSDSDDDLRTKKVERIPFDITELLETHQDVDLGSHKLMRLELSKMGDRGETGYYTAVQSIPFP